MEETKQFEFSELQRGTPEFDEQLGPFFEPSERLSFAVRTPEGAASKAPGVLIYISPKPGARMPENWGEVLDRHNLLWVGALDSGNEVHVARRVGLALLAKAVARRMAAIDDGRCLLSGFSGGGRVASMMMPAYPDVFGGALYICGANPVMVIDEETVAALQAVPMVFLTGTGDFNLEDTQFAISAWHRAGLRHAQLMIVDGLGHGLPEARDLDAALMSL